MRILEKLGSFKDNLMIYTWVILDYMMNIKSYYFDN